MLPTGKAARLHCQQIASGAEVAGLVVHVKMERAAIGPASAAGIYTRMLLPGLVGDAPLWRRQVEAAHESRTWLVLEGEAGVGKVSLLRAVHSRRQPAGRSTVLDAATAVDDPQWMATLRHAVRVDDTVIVQHVDALDPVGLRGMCAILDEVKRDTETGQLWVAVTRRPSPPTTRRDPLMSFFPNTVSVPPLRLHIDDLVSLVPFFQGKFGPRGHVTYSPESMRLLMRASWPGNVRQLQDLLHEVVQRRRSGVIAVEDLPPELHAISRRVLSTLETMERDAIVRALADAAGNKVQAARALGMSRATIYRKIHEFGILGQG